MQLLSQPRVPASELLVQCLRATAEATRGQGESRDVHLFLQLGHPLRRINRLVFGFKCSAVGRGEAGDTTHEEEREEEEVEARRERVWGGKWETWAQREVAGRIRVAIREQPWALLRLMEKSGLPRDRGGRGFL